MYRPIRIIEKKEFPRYFSDFDGVMASTDLTYEQLKSMVPSHQVVGHKIDNTLIFETVGSVKVKPNMIDLELCQLNGKHTLALVKSGDTIEIQHDKTQYSSNVDISSSIVDKIKLPESFSIGIKGLPEKFKKDTYDFLDTNYIKRIFRCLNTPEKI